MSYTVQSRVDGVTRRWHISKGSKMSRLAFLMSALFLALLLGGCDGGGSGETVGEVAPPGSLEVPKVGGATMGDPTTTPPPSRPGT